MSRPLLIVIAVTTGTVAVAGGSTRWFTVGLAMAVLGLAIAVILTPHKFLAYFDTDVRAGPRCRSRWQLSGGRDHCRDGCYRPVRGSSRQLPTGPVCGHRRSDAHHDRTIDALFAGWAWVRQLDGDDAEFPGGILVSPIGAVFVIAGALLLAATVASLLGVGRSEPGVSSPPPTPSPACCSDRKPSPRGHSGYGFPSRVRAVARRMDGSPVAALA